MSEQCGSCGAGLDVSARQGRRIRGGLAAALCRTCRGGRSYTARESDYRYWLARFGMSVPTGANALDVVRASGLPPDLARLATEFAPREHVH